MLRRSSSRESTAARIVSCFILSFASEMPTLCCTLGSSNVTSSAFFGFALVRRFASGDTPSLRVPPSACASFGMLSAQPPAPEETEARGRLFAKRLVSASASTSTTACESSAQIVLAISWSGIFVQKRLRSGTAGFPFGFRGNCPDVDCWDSTLDGCSARPTIGIGLSASISSTAGSAPSAFILISTAPRGRPILSILKNLINFGSSLNGGPVAPPPSLAGIDSGSFGSISSTAGSAPSAFILISTAPRGRPILSILKNLINFGSSFNGGPVAPPPSLAGIGSGSFGSISSTAGSAPSAFILISTAPRGSPILSILKYLANFGSSFNGGPVAPSPSASPCIAPGGTMTFMRLGAVAVAAAAAIRHSLRVRALSCCRASPPPAPPLPRVSSSLMRAL